MRDEMIPVKKHQIWFLTEGSGIERELLAIREAAKPKPLT
jgi:hypothetical protein